MCDLLVLQEFTRFVTDVVDPLIAILHSLILDCSAFESAIGPARLQLSHGLCQVPF